MTTVQTIELQMSETRDRLRELAESETVDRDAIQEAKGKLSDLELRYQAAVLSERQEAAQEPPEDGTGAELRRLRREVRFADYCQAAVEQRDVDGAAAELKSARGLSGKYIPWDVFDVPGRVEQRVDAVTSLDTAGGASQNEILRRVFLMSASAYAGVRMESVGIGLANYPVMTGGGSASTLMKGADKDSEEAVIPVRSLRPVRASARYVFAVEDAAIMAGLETTLRADMFSQVQEEVDRVVLTGSGTAPEPAGLLAGGLGPVPGDPNTAATLQQYLTLYDEQTDGRYATSPMGVKLLVSPTFNAAISKHFAADTYELATSAMARQGGGYRISAHVPAVTAAPANIASALTIKGPDMEGAVCPMWSGLELDAHFIRDPFTGAQTGRIALTLIALYSFQVLRAEQYSFLKFKTS